LPITVFGWNWAEKCVFHYHYFLNSTFIKVKTIEYVTYYQKLADIIQEKISRYNLRKKSAYHCFEWNWTAKCVFIVIVFLINNINQSKQKLANKIKNDERWKVYPSFLKQTKDME